ncbi:threonine/serine exporter family protein [Anaeromicropila herbilytica]|uniref:Membrane protein n=1 Tax=Anaeromicropila herbilytica TaxID=2785025 RepID=A0A7R7EN51_9FIRM|nr:threonine/serine exporter family protein [Anaeromicropila herbilytica]BCN31931.1 membrane protein [Anaeromicropila herbilytica]
MNYKLLVDTAILAGEIMLRSGAETYRVEDTIIRILRTSKLQKSEAFVTSTGIIVTLDDPTIDAISLVQRVTTRSTNLTNIYEANEISRKLCSERITIEEAYPLLKELKDKKPYPLWLVYACTVFTAVFFTVLLAGTLIDASLAFLNGILMVGCMILERKLRLHGFITNMLSSFLIAINTVILLSCLHHGVNREIIITGSIMPMVPGVAITNAIRDTLQGDYMSGSAKALEAFVSAASIAAGIGAGLSLGYYLGGML